MKVVEYVERDSPLHALDPRVNLLLAATVIVLGLVFTHPAALAGLFAAVLGLAVVGRVHRELLGWVRLLVPFALFSFVMWTVFGELSLGGTSGGGATRTLVTVGPLGITEATLMQGLGMPLRLLVMITTPLVFLMTVQRRDLVAALDRLGVPYKLAFGFGLVLRMVDVFIDEIREIRHAQQARGAVLDSGGLRTRVRANTAVLVPALVRGVKASEQLAAALELKGFANADNRTRTRTLRFQRRDYLAAGGCLVCLALGVALRLSGVGVA